MWDYLRVADAFNQWVTPFGIICGGGLVVKWVMTAYREIFQ